MPSEHPSCEHNNHYLRTKRQRLGHTLARESVQGLDVRSLLRVVSEGDAA